MNVLPSTSIDARLMQARKKLVRVEPGELKEKLEGGAILVDIRPEFFRETEGTHPDALVIERNVLEWRLDPNSDARIVDLSPDSEIIIMCNEGYASSLAAADLIELGIKGATDLVGGFRGLADLEI